MKRFPWGTAALTLAILLPPAAAEAVIPSAFGPIQALIVILPQLLLALAAGMLAIFKPRTYKLLGAYLWSHKVFTAVLLGIVGFLIWGPSLSSGKAAEEKQGVAWSAFRGGPQRTGVLPGEKGPMGPPRVLWKLAGDHLGPTSAVDSSPAVVGNRIYFGLSNQSAFGGGQGAIYALGTETGALAWKWTGEGLDPALRPVFSSPAVWVEPPEKGAPPAARYLVSGEGYHEDMDCRILCLDLDPVRKKEPPRLLWSVQTTSHVESAPCIHDGKVYIGCGDDGVWCVELATGKVLWRIEGGPHYEVEGAEAAKLSELVGKTVVATGVVRREGLGSHGKDDAGVLVLDVKTFKEHAGAPVTSMDSGRTYARTMTGKVVKPAQGRLRLEAEFFNPDSESPPIVVTVDKEPRLLFGAGIGGQRVNCVNAETGAVLWKSPTPFPAFGAPTVAGDRVLIGVGNGNFLVSDPNPAGALLCLSLKDGKELWKVATGDTIIGAAAVADNRAYACSRDGTVYVVDILKGEVVSKLGVGSPMVSSPAVTADAVYVSTNSGKIFAFDRRQGSVIFSHTLTADSPIFCSPAVADGKLFIGTRSKGVFALADRPKTEAAAAVKRWMGPGVDAGRTGCADDRGVPSVNGDEAILRWTTPVQLAKPATGPIAVSDNLIYASIEGRIAEIDGASGTFVKWHPYGTPPVNGGNNPDWLKEPARIYNLEVVASEQGLSCFSDLGALIWSVRTEFPPLRLPSVVGDKIFLTTAAKKAKGYVEARKLVDGSLIWRKELDDKPVSYIVATTDYVAVATTNDDDMTDDRIAVFRASDGKAREPIPVEEKLVAPAIWKDTLIVAGRNRVAAHDLSSSTWLWNYKNQDEIGEVTGQPVILNETIWVGTTKKGLIAIGNPPAQAKQ